VEAGSSQNASCYDHECPNMLRRRMGVVGCYSIPVMLLLGFTLNVWFPTFEQQNIGASVIWSQPTFLTNTNIICFVSLNTAFSELELPPEAYSPEYRITKYGLSVREVVLISTPTLCGETSDY
jgi:hypothetical protein